MVLIVEVDQEVLFKYHHSVIFHVVRNILRLL